MLSSDEKLTIAAILKNTEDLGSAMIANVIHQLLDDHRIEDIPEAVESYLSSAEINVGLKRAHIYANHIVGPILERYIRPALGEELSPAVKALPKWSLDPANRLVERLRDGMRNGANLKAEADAIVTEIQRAAVIGQ